MLTEVEYLPFRRRKFEADAMYRMILKRAGAVQNDDDSEV
jgi:hypothetical protein